MPSFFSSLLALPARTKAIVAVSGVAILAIAVLLLKLATAPSYTLLSSGVDPAQTGKVIAALDQAGVAYELRNNGTALAVQKAQVAQARVALAGQGVDLGSGGDQPGYELFDQAKLGASQFQLQVTQQRALEGEIARTVNGVSGVSSATVHLVLPQDDLFADTQTPATAAVALANPGDTLEPGAVRGIAQLVASSVKGLKADAVTITDGGGQLLWPQGDGAAAGGAGSTKQAAESRYALAMESNLNALLEQTLGPGKAQVQVNADLNVDKTSEKELVYAKKGVALRTQKETEQLQGGAAGAAGTAGTGANIPTYSANGAGNGGSGSNYRRSSGTTDWGVDKKVISRDVAPGAVNRLNLALVVDKSVPPAVVNSLKQTLATAAGLDAKRGDPPISVTQLAFAKAPVAKTGPVPTTLLGPLKWAGVGLGTLAFLFFAMRGLRKREGESLGTPSWLTTIEEPVPLAQLEEVTTAPHEPVTLPPREPDASLQQLDQLMDREPERVAAQVRQWMSED
jgi:flagellar M-ring protein FliF